MKEIWEHIAGDSIDAADRVLADIRGAFDLLAEMPGIGHARQEIGPQYRVWRVHSFLIVYRPDTRPLQVTRIVSGYRDMMQIML